MSVEGSQKGSNISPEDLAAYEGLLEGLPPERTPIALGPDSERWKFNVTLRTLIEGVKKTILTIAHRADGLTLDDSLKQFGVATIIQEAEASDDADMTYEAILPGRALSVDEPANNDISMIFHSNSHHGEYVLGANGYFFTPYIDLEKNGRAKFVKASSMGNRIGASALFNAIWEVNHIAKRGITNR